MKAIAAGLLCSVVVTLVALLAYHRSVVRPLQRIGVVDLSEVYRSKEAEFTRLLQGVSDDERARALVVARQFAERLPAALEELPRECRCLVVMRFALAGATPDSVDLTAALIRKVDAP